MRKSLCALILLLGLALSAHSQDPVRDSVKNANADALDMDSISADYDDLLEEMNSFLDSLLQPRSNFLVSVSYGSNYLNYWRRSFTKLEAVRKNIFSPVIGYFHRTGPGLTIAGSVTDDESRLNLYQFSVSPSFDFLKSLDWIGGVSYTRYFTKDSLPFYTSPLQNEFNGYFIWRKSWVQPGITLSYGYGSRSDFKKRERYIQFLRRRRLGSVINAGTTTNETVADFSATATVRHSFYWRRLTGRKDYLKFTPQLAFAAGTQKFGFNRSTSVYSVNMRNASNLLFSTGDVRADNELKFQPLSASLYLRPEYVIGKFFLQPQVILDYYFPGEEFTTVFSINAGLLF